ncbi:MFS transporter, PCFT/HCP family, solute carrier family 46 (folate transporter), member 1/3 [Mytilus galloprovincialis]|uniref:MFS transporter, PCFT/HCP family, solute carrier family 46 (Folate transporter), member 1/3 n=1 Tax=Mytilus galloprovincialis TaxID=29158 RepID=A0A8B6BIZ4_MYTGA|nr:MFS transporter, PCFT/HCP family, solute carrier family 46 (folate transporter), member 1/3 [Mytilus galloprovincialis]
MTEQVKKGRPAPQVEESVQRLTCRHFLMSIIIILMIYGNVVLGTAETQYGYYAVQRQKNITSVVSASRQSLCEANTSSIRFKQQQEVQSETANWSAYCHLAQSIPVLLMSLMVGSWSDKIGRRTALLVPTIGLIFKSGFFALAIKLEWNIYTLIIAYFVDGLCGMWISLIAASYSFAADLTKYGKSRLLGIVLIEIMLGVGVTIGALSSGYVIKYLGFLYGAVLVVSVACLLVLLIIFLPESVQTTEKLTSISQLKYLKNALSIYIEKDPLRYKYIILAVVFALNVLPSIGRGNVQSLYVMNSPFCWNAVYIGLFGALISFAQTIGVGLSRLLYKCMSKRAMIILGSISAIAYYLITAVAINDVMLFISPVVGLFGTYPITLIRAMMSQLTPKDKQGAMFGSLGAIDAVCSLIGSVASNVLYGATVSINDWLIWAVFGGFHVAGLLLFGLLLYKEAAEKRKIEDKYYRRC